MFKKLGNKLAYILIGVVFTIAGTVYAANVGVPQATQVGQVPCGLSSGNYSNCKFIPGPNMQITTSTPGQITFAAASNGAAAGSPGQVQYNVANLFGAGAALLTNGTVAGVNATSSTVSLNVQGSGTLNPFNVASSSGTSYLSVNSIGALTVPTLGTTTAYSSYPNFQCLHADSTGLFSGNDTDCESSKGINITKAPYYASGYTAIARSASSTAAGVTTSLTFDTVSGFSLNQYMYCDGSGASGKKERYKITGIMGRTITFTPATGGNATLPVCWTEGGTLTTGTTATGTSVSLASANTYSLGQGIYIAGAGALGTDFIATITAISNLTITLSTTTKTTVSAGALVMHDETYAFQKMEDDHSYTSFTAYVPGPEAGFHGVYNINGPFQATSTCNCVVRVPTIIEDASYYFIYGITHTYVGTVLPSPNSPIGSTIQTSRNAAGGTGSIFSGYAPAGGYGNFTNVILNLNKIRLAAYDDPNITMINATNISALSFTDSMLDVGESNPVIPPTHSNAYGIIFPTVINNASNILDNSSGFSFYTNFKLGEHMVAPYFITDNAVHGFEVYSSFSSESLSGHPLNIGKVVAEGNVDALFVKEDHTEVNIELLSLERNTGYDINCNGDKLYGKVTVSLINGFVPVVSSCRNALIYDLHNKKFTGGPVAYAPSCNGCNVGTLQNVSNTGYSSWSFLDDTGAGKLGVGYGNSGVGAPYNGNSYILAATNLLFGTNNVETMRLTTAGNLGIGTTTPSSALTVVGNIYATGNITCGGTCGGGGSGNSSWTIGNALIYNATSTDSVLVGTTTPVTSKFFIQGSGTKDMLTVASSSGVSVLSVYSTTTAPTLLVMGVTTANTILSLASSTGTSMLTFDSKGHLGFAGTAPTLTSCNTGTVLPNSTDVSGAIIPGAAQTTCTINFATARTNTPFCVVTQAVGSAVTGLEGSSTPTTLVITGTTIGSDTITYYCPGN